MGFAEVLCNLPAILRNIRFCKEDILSWKPDVLVLIDYPGFNLRIAEWAKKQGIHVTFYISPQVWAWKESRVKKMKTCIDKMICILPFEKAYYKDRWNWDVEYAGHPLVEVIDKAKAQQEIPASLQRLPANKPVIALLPGSRRQEISVKLPIMLSVAPLFPECSFVVAKAPGLEASFYKPFLEGMSNVATVHNQTYALLNIARAALVTSGTATLETALFDVPEVVCYKGNPISYQIAKRLIKIKFISLVNLIMDKPVVTELIQGDLTTENLHRELSSLLYNTERTQALQQDYQALKQLLSQDGAASANAARMVWEVAKGS
jgi:lipid-A-disaccharide synthase